MARWSDNGGRGELEEQKKKDKRSRPEENTGNGVDVVDGEVVVSMVVPDSAPNSPEHGDNADNSERRQEEREMMMEDATPPATPTAAAHAQERVRGVLFLCQQHRIETNPPWLPSDPRTFADALEHVKMKYVSSYDDVKMVMSAMHCREEADLPKLIVIDELRAICGSTASGFGGNGVAHARMGNGAFVPNESRRDNENKIAKALAHTKDAIEYIRARFRSASACHLMIADMHTQEYAINRSMYSKWIPNVFVAEKVTAPTPNIGDIVAEHPSNASCHENGHDGGGVASSPRYEQQREQDEPEQLHAIRAVSVSTSPHSNASGAATEAVATSNEITHARESRAIAVGDCIEYVWDPAVGAIHVRTRRAIQRNCGPPYGH